MPARARGVARHLCMVAFALATLPAALGGMTRTAPLALGDELAHDLFSTGLYAIPGSLAVDPAHLPFSPQYPLWTDGAAKQRWISLPEGSVIDASDPDQWQFPAGTRIWKEFAFGERRVETRYMEHLGEGRWIFGTYEWALDGGRATLAPERGRAGAFPLGQAKSHTIPGRADCRVCHGGGPSPVLGFTALQLSPSRDPEAIHGEPLPAGAVDLDELASRNLITGLDEDVDPRVAASDPQERAILGYLHGNCGHCHSDAGALASLGLDLAHDARETEPSAIFGTADVPLHAPPPGLPPDARLRIAPGDPAASGLFHRIGSRDRILQMPPLGTALVDSEAVEAIERWIENLQVPARKPSPS